MTSPTLRAAAAETAGLAESPLGDEEPRPTVLARVANLGWVMTLLSLGIMVGLWEFVVAVFSLPVYVLPAPGAVAAAIYDHFSLLAPNLGTTVLEVVEGFVAAIVVGVLVALLISSSKLAERLIYPLLVTSQAVPKIALAPVFLTWFGLGSLPRIVIAGLLAIFPIIINTTVGLVGVDKDLIRLAESAGASRRRVFWLVKLPGALPSFFSGLKLGVTLAVVGAVVGEFVGGDTGLGYIVTNAQGNLDMTLAFAAIVVLSALGVVLFYAVEAIERRFVRWV